MSASFFSAWSGELRPVFGATVMLETVAQYLPYVVAILLVTVMATLWLASNRVTLRQSNGRPDESRRRSSLHRWFRRSDDKGTAGKRRRRRRSQRRRNPTLAETGGLPPIRTEVPPATERYEP